jgi:NAD(P)-dependent dehydrogenase (short-subunit alcohol dehydrogenase family)
VSREIRRNRDPETVRYRPFAAHRQAARRRARSRPGKLAALPHLRAQGGERIVEISSHGEQVAFAENATYHATEWGIGGFAESVAQELPRLGSA